MQKQYQAPHVAVIGQAEDVVMGSTSGGTDHNTFGAPDFEFEHDWQLI